MSDSQGIQSGTQANWNTTLHNYFMVYCKHGVYKALYIDTLTDHMVYTVTCEQTCSITVVMSIVKAQCLYRDLPIESLA